MWCVAAGSKAEISGHRPLKIFRIVEYLCYNLAEERVEVCADFVLQNNSDVEHPLRFLHRGNILFENLTGDRPADKRYTPLYRDLVERWDPPTPNSAAVAPFRRIDEPDDEKHFVPFSLYETRPLPPGEPHVIRAFGEVRGLSYQRMICRRPFDESREKPHNAPMRVFGGQILIRTIEEEDIQGPDPAQGLSKPPYDPQPYRKLLDDFKAQYMTDPDTYHIIVDTISGKRHLIVSPLTHDLYLGCQDRKFDERLITHYWSKSALFSANSRLNGPMMMVEEAA